MRKLMAVFAAVCALLLVFAGGVSAQDNGFTSFEVEGSTIVLHWVNGDRRTLELQSDFGIILAYAQPTSGVILLAGETGHGWIIIEDNSNVTIRVEQYHGNEPAFVFSAEVVEGEIVVNYAHLDDPTFRDDPLILRFFSFRIHAHNGRPGESWDTAPYYPWTTEQWQEIGTWVNFIEDDRVVPFLRPVPSAVSEQ